MAQSYVETFNGGDNATPGIDHTWVEWANTVWENLSNEPSCTTSGAFSDASCRLDSVCDTDDMSIEATIKTMAAGGSYLAIYINGGGDSAQTFLQWQARADDDDYRAYYATGGSYTTLFTTSGVGVSVEDVMKIERRGRLIQFFVNGTEEGRHWLTDAQEAVLVGRRYGGLRTLANAGGRTFAMDDVTIEDVTVTTLNKNNILPPPPGAVLVPTQNLTSGIGYAWDMTGGTGVPVSVRENLLANRLPLTVFGTGGEWGVQGYRVNNGGENTLAYNAPNFGTNSTVFIDCTLHAINGSDPPYISVWDGGAPFWLLKANIAPDYDIVLNNDSTEIVFTNAFPGYGRHQIAVTREPTSPHWKCYIDGKFHSSVAEAQAVPFTTDDLNLGLAYTSSPDRMDVTIHALYFWIWETLTASAFAQLWLDPWLPFRPYTPLRPQDVVTLDTLSLTLATSISVDLGEIVIALDTLGLAAAVQNVSVVPGGVSISLDTLNITTVAETLNVANRVAVALDTLGLALGIPDITVVIPSVTIALDTLGLAASVQDLAVVPGEVIIPVDTLGLVAEVQTLSITSGVAVLLDTLALALGAETISVVPGAVTISLDELSLALEAVGLQVTGGPRVAPAIRTFIVEAEDRTFIIDAEDRTFVVDEEDRTLAA